MILLIALMYREPSGSVTFSLVRGGTTSLVKYLNAGLGDWMASWNTLKAEHTAQCKHWYGLFYYCRLKSLRFQKGHRSYCGERSHLHSQSTNTPRPTVLTFTAYLHDILGVLCWILEDGVAVLQVFLVQGERLLVQALTHVPHFCLLQVGQEIRVDRATLNERHAAETSTALAAFLPAGLFPSELRRRLTGCWSVAGGWPDSHRLPPLQTCWRSRPH